MKILHLKYKMHKLVNLVFYLIIFGIGFLLGFTSNKIDINKIITQFLFIDNVNAYSIRNKYDEEYIYTHFSRNENFDINEYPFIYVICGQAYFNNKYHNITQFFAFPKDFFKKNELVENSHTYQNENEIFNYYKFSYNENFDVGDTSLNEANTFSFFTKPSSTWIDSSISYYSNFDLKELSDDENLKYNLLDFSNYITSSDDNNDDNDDENDDNIDEDIDVNVVNSSFYEFAQKIFGEVSEENKFIYDFITFGLVVICFTLFVLIIGYILKKFLGG